MLEKITTQDSKLKAVSQDFIPYACHYDQNTILTKNGELLQIIKITSFSSEKEGDDLRKTLRTTLKDLIEKDYFAFWFHTVRIPCDLSIEAKYPNFISQKIDDLWNESNSWSTQYVNEIYLSIVIDGMAVKPFHNIKDAIFFKAQKKQSDLYLNWSHQELNIISDQIVEHLAVYNAKKLGMVEDDGIYYSEILRFFNKISNFTDEPILVPIRDLSAYLATQKANFGFNIFEIKKRNIRKFGAIFVVKQYIEILGFTIDYLLQLDQELIVTEIDSFASTKKSKEFYEYKNYIYNLSKDSAMQSITGIDELAGDGIDDKSKTSFINRQITITLYNDSLSGLEKDINSMFTALGKIGLVVVRADIRLEQLYWSCLPANFAFVSHQLPDLFSKIGAFWMLHSFSYGLNQGARWKKPITILNSLEHHPYYFNFHSSDTNGHMLIFGTSQQKKDSILSFLLLQSMKLDPMMIMIDYAKTSHNLVRAMDGVYQEAFYTGSENHLKMNLFATHDQEVQIYILDKMIKSSNRDLDVDFHDKLLDLVEIANQIPETDRRLSTAIAMLDQEHYRDLIAALKDWYDNGIYAAIFDNLEDEMLHVENVFAVDISNLAQDEIAFVPFLSFFLFRINQIVIANSVRPKIIVVNDALFCFDIEELNIDFNEWLQFLDANNCVVIFATNDTDDTVSSDLTPQLIELCNSKIFTPYKFMPTSYKKILNLTDHEYQEIRRLQNHKGQILLKNSQDMVVIEMEENVLRKIGKLFADDDASKQEIESLIEKYNGDSNQWVQELFA